MSRVQILWMFRKSVESRVEHAQDFSGFVVHDDSQFFVPQNWSGKWPLCVATELIQFPVEITDLVEVCRLKLNLNLPNGFGIRESVRNASLICSD